MQHRSLGSTRHSRAYSFAGASAAVLALAAVAACGSSASTTTNSSSSGGNGSGVSATVKAAHQKDLQAPTKIGVSEPLKSRAPAGRTLVRMQCENVQCAYTTKGVEEATKALNWQLKIINYKFGDPSTLVDGLKQALQYHPVAVSLDGLPPAVWQSVIPAYRQAGVAIIPGFLGPVELNDVVVANLWNPDDLAVDMQMLARWVAVDSNGHGKAVFLGEPFFPGFATEPDAFKKELAQACPGCTVTVVNASLAQSASPAAMNGVLVSALQRDPSIKYAISIDGVQTAGLPAAVQGAGLSGVKIASALAGLEDTTAVAQGTEAAATGADFTYYGWLAVDTAVRYSEHLPISPGDGGMPHQLLVQSNVGKPFTNLNKPADYRDQFKALWKVQ